MKTVNEKIFELNDQGLKPGKIAQKLKVKKVIVEEILGQAGKSVGLGDVVESITRATGIKAVVDAVVDDCGCKARATALNKLFPNKKLRDLMNDQYYFLKSFFEPSQPGSVNRATQVKLVEIYNHVFSSKREVSSCGTCVANMVKQLKKVYDAATHD